jgi:hypothetical protein
MNMGTVVFNDDLPLETIYKDVVIPIDIMLYVYISISNCLLYTI